VMKRLAERHTTERQRRGMMRGSRVKHFPVFRRCTCFLSRCVDSVGPVLCLFLCAWFCVPCLCALSVCLVLYLVCVCMYLLCGQYMYLVSGESLCLDWDLAWAEKVPVIGP